MRSRDFLGLLRRSEACEAGAVFAGLAVGILLRFLSMWSANQKEPETELTWSRLLKQWVHRPLLEAFEAVFLNTDILVKLLITLALFLGLALFGCRVSRKMYESEEVL